MRGCRGGREGGSGSCSAICGPSGAQRWRRRWRGRWQRRAKSRAYAESIRSAAELQERLLYEEREEARQLALAMEQSVAYSGALDEEQQAAFLAVCDQAGVSPCDIQWPVQVPRVSDNARELKFSRKCRARRIVFDGREERSQKKLDAIRAARSMAEVVMAERFGPTRGEAGRVCGAECAGVRRGRLIAGQAVDCSMCVGREDQWVGASPRVVPPPCHEPPQMAAAAGCLRNLNCASGGGS